MKRGMGALTVSRGLRRCGCWGSSEACAGTACVLSVDAAAAAVEPSGAGTAWCMASCASEGSSEGRAWACVSCCAGSGAFLVPGGSASPVTASARDACRTRLGLHDLAMTGNMMPDLWQLQEREGIKRQNAHRCRQQFHSTRPWFRLNDCLGTSTKPCMNCLLALRIIAYPCYLPSHYAMMISSLKGRQWSFTKTECQQRV